MYSGASMDFSNNGTDWSGSEDFALIRRNWDLTANGGGVEDGHKTVYVRLKDSAGNWTTDQIVVGVVLDRISPIVSVTPVGGDYNSVQTVILNSSEAGSIYYSTDGSLPDNSSVLYESPIIVDTNTTLRFFAEDLAENKSVVFTEVYNIAIASPDPPDDCIEGVETLTCGVGACRRTVDACAGGVPNECVPGVGSVEVCDGVDNDCDSSVDEDLGTTSCGVGDCRRMVDACVNGSPGICVPAAPADEVCDGFDNDCDGLVNEGCRPTFNVMIDLNDDPVTVCFTTYQTLNDDPVVTLLTGQGIMMPVSGAKVSPAVDPCSGFPSYCVDYELDTQDSEVSIRTDEDRNNPIITTNPGYEIANFLVTDPDHERATSFCVDNGTDGSGMLLDERCKMALFIEYGQDDLTVWGPEDECALMRIIDIDPASVPAPADTVVTGLYEIGLSGGAAIADGKTLTVTLSFELPYGIIQFDDNSKVFEVYYFDDVSESWKQNGINITNIQWDTDTTGALTFTTTHLTKFVATVRQNGGDGNESNGSAKTLGTSGAGGGCYAVPGIYNMSKGSAIANTLILLLPLIVIGIGRGFKRKNR